MKGVWGIGGHLNDLTESPLEGRLGDAWVQGPSGHQPQSPSPGRGGFPATGKVLWARIGEASGVPVEPLTARLVAACWGVWGVFPKMT